MRTTLLIKLIISTLLLSNTLMALASDAPFKVAIVKDALGSKDIALGEIKLGIDKLSASKKSQTFYANKMSLCVAYLQANYSEKSESACTAAIISVESFPQVSSSVRYLTSLSYSNRGVARYKNNDLTAALNDFESAVIIDENPITIANLAIMKQRLPTVANETAILSD